MLKKRKNIISIMLSGLLVICIAFFSALSAAAGSGDTQTQQAEQDMDAAMDTIFDKQRDASEAGENIDEFLRCVPTGRANRATSYPDYYAGSYIDNDGKLAVMLTENAPEIRQTLSAAAGNSAVRFESAQYSYEELTQIMNLINSKIEKNLQSKKDGTHQPNFCDSITGAALYDDKNIIEVYIKDLNITKVQSFQNNILNSNAIVLKETPGPTDETALNDPASTAPGRQIGVPLIDGMEINILTTAFRVKRSTNTGVEQGFLTCGHGDNNKIGTSVYSRQNQIITGTLGTIQLHREAGAYDLSYVSLKSGSSVSNIIAGTNYSLGPSNDYIDTPTTGKAVVLYGSTTKCTSGTIKSINETFVYNSINYTGMIGANYNNIKGDSGGLVCSNRNNYTYYAMGIHRGNANGHSVFTSAKKAVNLWYLNRY